MLVDSHCHLNYAGVEDRQAEVLTNARRAGVTGMLNISTRASEWDAVIATAEREPDVWAAIGIHPHEADAYPEIDAATLAARTNNPRVIGIGESGLDYHYDHSDRVRQQESFRAHIAAARQTGLPVIVHTRDAEADTLAIMADEMGKGAFPGLIHCFTASAGFARDALALGLFISVAGIVTFKNAKDLQTIVRDLPENRLLIETDSPFLAPVPHRGRPCEPAYLPDTLRFIAALRGVEPEQLGEATARNFAGLFGKAGL